MYLIRYVLCNLPNTPKTRERLDYISVWENGCVKMAKKKDTSVTLVCCDSRVASSSKGNGHIRLLKRPISGSHTLLDTFGKCYILYEGPVSRPRRPFYAQLWWRYNSLYYNTSRHYPRTYSERYLQWQSIGMPSSKRKLALTRMVFLGANAIKRVLWENEERCRGSNGISRDNPISSICIKMTIFLFL